eukprot:747249-Hanusia_phi.AAC.4
MRAILQRSWELRLPDHPEVVETIEDVSCCIHCQGENFESHTCRWRKRERRGRTRTRTRRTEGGGGGGRGGQEVEEDGRATPADEKAGTRVILIGTSRLVSA